MISRNVVLIATALTGAALVSAQAAPNWAYVPSSCATACSKTVQTAYMCQTQFTTSLDIYGCYCNAFPSDAASCATCLNNNNAAALGQLVTSTITACPQAAKSCFFQCSFPTCNSADIPCQCSTAYLQNIYNCASCNTNNGNTGVTLLSDYQALDTSCKAQSYTGAGIARSAYSTPSASNQAAYQAPSLTAAGGGAAATGGAAIAAGTSGFTAAANGAAASPVAGGNGAGNSVAAANGYTAAAGSANSAAVVAAGGASTVAPGTAPTTLASQVGGSINAKTANLPTVSVSIAPATTAKSGAFRVAAPASGALVAAAVVAGLL